MNQLHRAACGGSAERTIAVLSRGAVDIDERDSAGFTALIMSVIYDHPCVARILLNQGANLEIVDNNRGATALHWSALEGHLEFTIMLLKAGAALEARTPFPSFEGSTPLHWAVAGGHPEVVSVLVEAGANPNSRMLDYGATPMSMAAQVGHVEMLRVLVRAEANPLLAFTSSLAEIPCVPLDVAVGSGHVEFVQELIQEYGIEGCGGPHDGVTALTFAATNQHVHMMSMLTSAGVVDTGVALTYATFGGRESSVKFLLQQQEERKARGEGAGYLEYCNIAGSTPMLNSILACSPRITRMLVDAGADATTAVRTTPEDGSGGKIFNGTPLAVVEMCIETKTVRGKDATERQLRSCEATRRLLMRLEAVHAVSWLWANDAPFVIHAAAAPVEGKGKTMTAPTLLTLMLPTLRRRAGKPRMLLAALFRHSGKPY